jgi:hypothetical protein
MSTTATRRHTRYRHRYDVGLIGFMAKNELRIWLQDAATYVGICKTELLVQGLQLMAKERGLSPPPVRCDNPRLTSTIPKKC